MLNSHLHPHNFTVSASHANSDSVALHDLKCLHRSPAHLLCLAFRPPQSVLYRPPPPPPPLPFDPPHPNPGPLALTIIRTACWPPHLPSPGLFAFNTICHRLAILPPPAADQDQIRIILFLLRMVWVYVWVWSPPLGLLTGGHRVTRRMQPLRLSQRQPWARSKWRISVCRASS